MVKGFKTITVNYINGTTQTYEVTNQNQVDPNYFSRLLNGKGDWISMLGTTMVWINKQNILNISIK